MCAVPAHRSIQGVDLAELAAAHGTPLYVYDADVIRRQIARLREAFPGTRLLFAAKALTTVGVLELMRDEGLGLETVSIEEVRLALHAGFEPQELLFTPSCPGLAELTAAVELGVLCNLESLSSLDRFGARFGSEVPVALRLDPRLRDGQGQIAVWYDEGKFGIEAGRADEILALLERHGTRVVGLHVHSNHVVQDADVLLAAAEVVFALARRLPDVRFLDFGGGFNVSMEPGQEVHPPAALARPLLPALERLREELGRPLELWIEPGRFLVAECGLLLARVHVLKPGGDALLAGLDTGFHHLVRPKMYGAYHGIRNVTNPDGPQRSYTVVGNLCEGDTFATDRPLPEIREGDLLALENAGAYGASMASNYNSRPRPAEVLVDGGEARLVRRRETLDDLLRTQTGATP
jgi:diaminopimelate decarboxylase